MSIVLLVYLASISKDLSFALVCLSVLGFLGLGVYTLAMIVDFNKKFDELGVKKWFVLCFISLFTAVLLPSEKTIYIMAGASIAQDIANSPKTAATLDKVYKIVDKKLDEQLSEGIDKATKKMEEAAK
jgi:hypothetical protein